MWMTKSSVSEIPTVGSVANIGSFLDSPVLVQMLNKWYFIGF